MSKEPANDVEEASKEEPSKLVKSTKNKGKKGADTSTGRGTGRPKGRHDPDINWEAIEADYVWGETISKREDGTYVRKYPTLVQIGDKHGISKSLVHYYAKKHGWEDRRLRAISTTKEEFDKEMSKSRARETVEAMEVLDEWLLAFAENVRLKKVRADSIGDLNTVVRLKQFLKGDADSRSEQKVVVSLETLQARHRNNRGRVDEADGAYAGELGDEDVLSAGALPEETPAAGVSGA
jgi:hypothetical protein